MPKISKHAGPTVEANPEATRLSQAQQAQAYPVAVTELDRTAVTDGTEVPLRPDVEHPSGQSGSAPATSTVGPEEPLAEGAGDIRATPREPVAEDRTGDSGSGTEPEFVPVSEARPDQGGAP